MLAMHTSTGALALEEPTLALLGRLRAGQEREECFAALFRRFHDRVYRTFPGWVPSAVRSELTQEVFLKVYRHLDTLPEERFEPWLHRVARRTFLSWYEAETRLKRRGVAVPWEDPEARAGPAPGERQPSPAASPLDDALSRERQRVVRAAIEELPKQMRSCVLLRLHHDWSLEEIARVLRLAPGTVKAHLHGARSRLKSRLAAYFSEIRLVERDPS
jgi:RNA polymerase sigma-70 factor (ECF subfamily)